jgi:TolB-like protein/DNA-binding SARP family transcriptional activator
VNWELLYCDAITFEQCLDAGRAAEALGQYGGELLSGFYVPDAPHLERWLETERSRLRERAVSAARSLSQLAGRAHDLPEAVRWTHKAVEIAPESEQDVRRLIELMDQAGDRAGALRVYDEYARRLATDYELEPGSETQRVIERIRAHEYAGTSGGADRAGGGVVAGAGAEGSHAREREEVFRQGESAGVAVLDAPGPGTREPVRRAPAPSRAGTALRWLGGLALAALLVVVLRPLFRPATQPDRKSVAAVAPGPPTSVAVLYFQDNSRDGKLGYLAAAITNALIEELSDVRALSVVSNNGVSPYRSNTVPLDSIARVLHVGSMVGGSVESSRDSVRIRVQLIDASNGRALYSDVVTKAMGDEFGLVDGVVRDVADFLRVHLGKEIELKSWQAGTTSVEAWNLVKGADEIRDRAKRMSQAGNPGAAITTLENADAMLVRAQVLDAQWTEPLFLRSRVAEDLGWLNYSPAKPEYAVSWFEKARSFAEAALRIKSDDAALLEQRGELYYLIAQVSPAGSRGAAAADSAAERDLTAATHKDPGRARAWSQLSAILESHGEYAKAKFAAEQAYQADAYLRNSKAIMVRLFTTTFELGQDGEARKWCDEISAKNFDSTAALCRLQLMAWAYQGTPKPDEAWRVVEQSSRSDPPQILALTRPRLIMLVGAVLARAGLADSARAVIDRAAHDAASDPERAFFEAAGRSVAGQGDVALQLLQTYINESPALRNHIGQSRIFSDLRRLPAYRTLSVSRDKS